MNEFFGRTCKRFRQDGIQMNVQVELERIQQVLYVEPGFRFTFDGQLSRKEQGIRVLFTPGQPEEVVKVTGDDDVGSLSEIGLETGSVEQKVKSAGNILDMECNGLPLDFDEPRRDVLTTSGVIKERSQNAAVQAVRHGKQENS